MVMEQGRNPGVHAGLGLLAGQGWLMGHWGKAGTKQSHRDYDQEPK